MDYQKLYAYLVGQVDCALQMIAGYLINGDPGQEEMCAVGERLKEALLTAEEMYLDGAEEG